MAHVEIPGSALDPSSVVSALALSRGRVLLQSVSAKPSDGSSDDDEQHWLHVTDGSSADAFAASMSASASDSNLNRDSEEVPLFSGLIRVGGEWVTTLAVGDGRYAGADETVVAVVFSDSIVVVDLEKGTRREISLDSWVLDSADVPSSSQQFAPPAVPFGAPAWIHASHVGSRLHAAQHCDCV